MVDRVTLFSDADHAGVLDVGDCVAVLAGLPDACFDSIVTDPPYGLSFMGKDWDSLGHGSAQQAWHARWLLQALRVLKPGGHLIAAGGTRTYHRLACAVEDAGFEIRDSLHWIYGTGQPHGIDIGKAIDAAAGAERPVLGPGKRHNSRAYGTPHGDPTYNAHPGGVPPLTGPATPDAATWEGWNTALKPAHEPFVLARKPFPGTVIDNVLRYGAGGLNVAACSVPLPAGHVVKGVKSDPAARSGVVGTDLGFSSASIEKFQAAQAASIARTNAQGRWPPNLLLSHAPSCDRDGDGRCAPGCPVAELDTQSGPSRASAYYPVIPWAGVDFPFRYVPKAAPSEREAGAPVDWDGDGRWNLHPTVKPVALMRWFVQLVTRPGGVILDPFGGTMTTGIAALQGGFSFHGIDQDAGYRNIGRARLAYWLEQG